MCCTALPKSCHGGWDLEYIHPNYDISSFVFNLLGQTAPLLLFMICHSCNSPAEVIALSLRWFGVRNAWVNSTVNVERSRRGERLVPVVSLLQLGSWGQAMEQFAVSLKKRWWQDQDSNSALLHLRQKHLYGPVFLMIDEIPHLRIGWFKDQWYLWTKSCCPWMHRHIGGEGCSFTTQEPQPISDISDLLFVRVLLGLFMQVHPQIVLQWGEILVKCLKHPMRTKPWTKRQIQGCQAWIKLQQN